MSLCGPIVCLPFGVWLVSLLSSRYRAPLGLLAGGLGLYGLHTFVVNERWAAALASAGGGLMAGGVLIYYRRPGQPKRAPDSEPVAAPVQ